MIPERLVVQGLYSFIERQEVDFLRLSEGRLFGIFGPVGSGKSSLLEAMSFALFGETERMNAQENRRYNMMNLRSSQLFIEFIFRTGRQAERRFRFTVEGRRSKKEFDKVGHLARAAYEWVEGEWRPLATTDGAEVTGLSYDHFRRVVIIPQGKFQEFLHLKDADRAQMMKELFHLERFDLDGKAALLQASTKAAHENVKGQLQQVPEVTPAQLQELDQTLRIVQAQARELALKVQALATQEEQMQQHRQLAEQEQAAAARLQALTAQSGEWQRRAQQAQLAQRTRAEVLPTLQRWTTSQAQHTKAVEALAQAQQAAKAAAAELERLHTFTEHITRHYHQRDALRQRQEHLLRAAEALAHLAEAETLTQRMHKGARMQQEQEELLEQMQKSITHVTASIQQRSAESQLPEGWQQLQQWYQRHAELRAVHTRAQQRTAQAQAQEAALQGTAQDRLRQEQQHLPWVMEVQPQHLQDRLREEEQALQQHLAHLTEGITTHQLTERLTRFAEELQEGQPCPLCGALHHPHPFSPADSLHHLQALRQQAAHTEAQMQRCRDLRTELHSLQQRLQEAGHRTASEQTEETQALADLNAHMAAFHWQGFNPGQPEQLSQLITQAEAAARQRDTLERQRTQLTDELSKATSQLETIRKGLDTLQGSRLTAQAKADALLQGNPEAAPGAQPDALRAEAAEMARQHTQATEAYDGHMLQLREAEERHTLAQTASAAATASANALHDRATADAQALQDALQALGLQAVEAAQQLLQQVPQPEEVLRQAEHHRTALTAAEAEWRLLKAQCPPEPYPAEAHAQLSTQLAALRSQEQQAQQRFGSLQSEKATLTQALETRTTLMQQLEVGAQRLDDLSTLRQLFRGNGFVRHVSTGYLSGLAHEANQRFSRLTRNRLSLELDDEGNFVVRDHLNGGQLRSVKTLSGGQTFQAALCLALALSDLLAAEHGQHQNFFFLDEGFGTLDKDALAVVFQTLMELRRENRIVGVISHVEEMQEEIDTWLSLRLHEERGTLVRGSWEMH